MDLRVIYIEVVVESMDVDEFTEESILETKLLEGREQNLKDYAKVSGSSLQVKVTRKNCGVDPQRKFMRRISGNNSDPTSRAMLIDTGGKSNTGRY